MKRKIAEGQHATLFCKVFCRFVYSATVYVASLVWERGSHYRLSRQFNGVSFSISDSLRRMMRIPRSNTPEQHELQDRTVALLVFPQYWRTSHKVVFRSTWSKILSQERDVHLACRCNILMTKHAHWLKAHLVSGQNISRRFERNHWPGWNRAE